MIIVIHENNEWISPFEAAFEKLGIDYQIWYHGRDGKHSLVGELTLGENGVDVFYKQWVMNDRQFKEVKEKHDKIT